MDDAQNLSYQSLLHEFESTKKALGEAEEGIKRITGRDSVNFSNGVGPNKWKNQQQQGQPQNRLFLQRKRPLFPITKAKDDAEQAEEESPEEDEVPSKKPALQSTVVATPKDIKSRKESIQEQNSNSKVKARNRRMFGMILGTLQKFQTDSKKRQEQDLKRAEIEQKVEAAAAEEKEKIKKEKEELFHTRKEKQIQLRCLEKKLEIAEAYETWEHNNKVLINFIKTETEPHLFYLPAKHNANTQKRLEESKAKTLTELKEKKEKMEQEISQVEEWYKKDSFPIDKENIGPLENDIESQELPAEEDEEMPLAAPENEIPDDTPEERTHETNLENLADQEFEPIYD